MDYNERLQRKNSIPTETHTRRIYTGRAVSRETGYRWAGVTRFFMSNTATWMDENLEPEDWKRVRITSRLVLATRCVACDGDGVRDVDCPDGIDPDFWSITGNDQQECRWCDGEGVAYVGECDGS